MRHVTILFDASESMGGQVDRVVSADGGSSTRNRA